MDNFKIDVTSEGAENFKLAMRLAFLGKSRHSGYSATHYADLGEKGLAFYWTDCPGALKLPCKLDAEGAADLALRWMAECPDEKRQGWCDHDGSNGHGFRVYNDDWGHVAGAWQGICAVQPVWAWYGK